MKTTNHKAKTDVRRMRLHNHSIGGCNEFNPQAIFIPRHRKFKGYDRENRKSTFNKNR